MTPEAAGDLSSGHRPRIGISNLAWPPDQAAQALVLLQSLGVAGVEVAPTRIADWGDLKDPILHAYRRSIESAGLVICSLQAILFGRPELQLLSDDFSFSPMVEHLRRVGHIAQALGAGVAVFGAPHNRLRGSLPPREAEDLAAERLRVLGEVAMAAGLTLGIEPIPAQYGADFLLRAEDVRRVVAMVSHDGVGVHLDSACVGLGGDDLAAEIATTGGGLKHYHVAEPNLGAFEAPWCGHAGAARALERQGYSGWKVIEMREQPSALDAIRTAVAFAKDCYH